VAGFRQFFPTSANTIAKASIVGGLLTLVALGGGGMAFYRSPFVTQVDIAREQVVPFSHRHHVAGLGIDCRYCHTSVEDGAFAGIPSTETCMTCHSQVWTNADLLQPVRDSWLNDEPLHWTRVHDTPDFVYFDHSIHVNKGIGCTECHGRVDQMPLTWKVNTLHMGWCLQCHRNPEKYIRPKEAVFEMAWNPQAYDETRDKKRSEFGPELVSKYNIKTGQLENCSVCHR
jgi:hypothetical protein